MKKIILLATLALPLFLSSCLVASVLVPVPLTNHSNDSILVFVSRVENNIDSVRVGLRSVLRFDEAGKIVFDETRDVTNPGAEGSFRVFGHRPLFLLWATRGIRRQAFHHRNGYFFIIKLETVRNYTWDEIRKNRLYNTLIVTRETFRRNGWRIDYYGAVRE